MKNKQTGRRVLAPALAMVAGLGLAGAVGTAAMAMSHAKNPCAAKAANPCAAKNPCAANPCAAKNPCAANPCAAKNPCAANPCAAKNPCAANPCAAKNPCAANPCAAKNPCAANPCAAKNPCAANPCAASNPCAANPCAPAKKAATLTDKQATAAYKSLAKALQAGYAKSGVSAAKAYSGWKKYNTVPYASATHGGRYVNNFANAKAKSYNKYDGKLVLPVGSVIAKDSISALPGGKGAPGPFFLMEKMAVGWNKASADWKYTLIMPTGAVIGVTKGKGDASVKFCAECHQAAGVSQLFFLPENYRVK